MEVLILLEPTVYSTEMESCIFAFVAVYAHTALYTYTHTDRYVQIYTCMCVYTHKNVYTSEYLYLYFHIIIWDSIHESKIILYFYFFP